MGIPKPAPKFGCKNSSALFILAQKISPLKEPLFYKKPDDVISIDRKTKNQLKLIASAEDMALESLLKRMLAIYIKKWKGVING